MAPLSEDELTALKRKRDLITKNLVRVKKGIEDKTLSLSPSVLDVRLELVTTDVEKVLEIQSIIEEHDLEDNNRPDLEDICIETKALIMKLIRYSHSSTLIDSTPAPVQQSRLPKLSLPQFSGKYSEFKNFISMFENLVHRDASIPDIEKFNHLVSCLSGKR